MVVDFLIALLLTIVVEELVAYAAGYRQKQIRILIVLVNIITNPLLNYVLILAASFSILWLYHTCVLLLEVPVVLAEWKLLCYGLGKDSKRLLKLSFGMNVASVSAGAILAAVNGLL